MLKKILDIQKNDAALHLKKLGFSDGSNALQNLLLLRETPLKAHLEEFVNLLLTAPSPDNALNNIERIGAQLSPEIINSFIKNKEKLQHLIFICGSSNLLANTIINNPIYIEQLLLEGGLERKKDLSVFLKELLAWVHDLHDFSSIAKALRLFKQREYLRIGARDILGLASMQETTEELSGLASASLEIAYWFCLAQLKAEYGTPLYIDLDGSEKESEFVIIGMGKLGGRELNFSSDIDIIYIYSSDKGETTGIVKSPSPPFMKGGREGISGKIHLHTFYVKLSEMITKLIGSITEDGVVFRVDLNLRPEGKNGDLANSLRSAEIYYESWGQTWERAAMIKARPVAGSMELGEDFLKMIEPFVYRRYLDFTAIEEIRGMKEKIDLSLLRAAPDAVDVKLGIGGIREIEFFIQTIQLINGGKDKAIREKNTLRSIELLKQRGYIPEQDASVLTHAYIFLRNLEHRIQIVEGRQTQVIPAKAAETERLAKMLEFFDTSEMKAADRFWDEYKNQTENVHEIYDNLFYKHSKEIEEGVSEDAMIILSDDLDKEEIITRLSKTGFQEPTPAYENLKHLKEGPTFVRFPVRARTILKRITPFLFTLIINSPAPDMALKNLERFISSIGGITAFYSLLAENKKVMELLIKLFSTSEFLSAALIEHPENLDNLLSPELNIPRKNKDELFEKLSTLIAATEDYEAQLDIIRRFRNSEIFRIGINDIFGELEPADISEQITYTADICLIKAYEIGIQELEKRFGLPGNNSRFAVIGLGKFGGNELIYSSDLDIIFVYSVSGETSGPKVISNHEFFAKLGQRIITTLSVVTKEGVAFKVDTRLRPSGSSGPLCTSEDAFIRYHKETAQIWEKQAMLKARFIAGNPEFGSRILHEIQEHIYAKPPVNDDLKELYRIRQRMEIEIAKEGGGRYNIKVGKGGLVDIEFAVQILQLKFGKETPSIRESNTINAIEVLKRAGIISEADYTALKEAYKFYRFLENRLRIVQNRTEGDIVKDTPELLALAKRIGYKDGADKKLLQDYLNQTNIVRDIYKRIIGIEEKIVPKEEI